MNQDRINNLLEICRAITAERDREALLTFILNKAIDIASCDAGTLYLLEDNKLSFCRLVTRSMNIHQGGYDAPISLPPVPLNEHFACSWVAIHEQTCIISDVYTDEHFDFTGTRQYDKITGYRTKSMLIVPMLDDKRALLGVMQLINAVDEEGNIIPFDSEAERLISAVASQAAISIINMQYNDQIKNLLDSLVSALSTAIDERSHYNADHTRHMVVLAEHFLDWLSNHNHPLAFSPEKRREFLMAVWLHDVGKIAVPLEIMDKNNRLGSHLNDIKQRFKTMKLLDRIAFLENRIDANTYNELMKEKQTAEEFINRVNNSGFISDEDLSDIDALSKKTFIDENGDEQGWLTAEEQECLSIRKGTLTKSEREIMQGHVQITQRILNSVSFPPDYSHVSTWASTHHELLNGKGYNRHLSGEDIPFETRLLTILDIYEALTAKNRPYKKAMSPEKAFSILFSMAEEGSIDFDIIKMFEESKSWEAII